MSFFDYDDLVDLSDDEETPTSHLLDKGNENQESCKSGKAVDFGDSDETQSGPDEHDQIIVIKLSDKEDAHVIRTNPSDGGALQNEVEKQELLPEHLEAKNVAKNDLPAHVEKRPLQPTQGTGMIGHGDVLEQQPVQSEALAQASTESSSAAAVVADTLMEAGNMEPEVGQANEISDSSEVGCHEVTDEELGRAIVLQCYAGSASKSYSSRQPTREKRKARAAARHSFFDFEELPAEVLTAKQRGFVPEPSQAGVKFRDQILERVQAVAQSGSAEAEEVEAPEDQWLCCDSEGSPLGRCKKCKEDCKACVLSAHTCLHWELSSTLVDHPLHCEKCNCLVSDHERWDSWFSQCRTSLKRFRDTGHNTKMERPSQSQVPVDALEWEPEDVALYVLTEGVFDPRRDGRGEGNDRSEDEDATSSPLVSCVTPTSSARQDFHPLLYECFRTQEYEPKELVVVETGKTPSAYLLECARMDPRVIYRFFPVDDARMQDLSETVVEPEPPQAPARPVYHPTPGAGKGYSKGFGGKNKLIQQPTPDQQWHQEAVSAYDQAMRLKNRLKGRVRGGSKRKGWSLGTKRNVLCQLAKGDAIAHFDDDDLYSPIYLGHMVRFLREAARYKPVNGKLPAAAATLEAWHVLDMSDQTFGFFAPKSEELLEPRMRESFAYGFGFSYIYSKAAWNLQPFADVEWSEDGAFTGALLAQNRPVKLINPRFLGANIEAIAAHSHHRESTSGGEFTEVSVQDGWRSVVKAVRMGKKVPGVPKELADLLALVRCIVKSQQFRKGEVHPVRREVSGNNVRGEIGFADKQDFMKTYDRGGVLSQAHAPKWGVPGINRDSVAGWGRGWANPMKGKGKGLTPAWPGGKVVGATGQRVLPPARPLFNNYR